MSRKLGLAGLLLLLALPARAEERITEFLSRIEVQPDGALVVTETITVMAEGRKIRRGIYRDLPTDYTGRLGARTRVGFELLETRRAGAPEPHHTERIANGVRVYLGDKDRLLAPGLHTYTLAYRTTRQVGFFAGYDEVYWNVTGTGWEFPIDRAAAVVVPPRGARAGERAAYTGRMGERGADYRAEADDAGNPRFVATRRLLPGEGLTVAVAFPKGFVAQPTDEERLHDAVRDNAALVAGLAGLLVVVAYYLFAWVRVGRDPAAGPAVPLYEPPDGITPAAARFIVRMGFDDKTIAATVVSLAVKGALAIDEREGGGLVGGREFALMRTKGPAKAALSAGEKAVLAALFVGGRQTVVLKPENHAVVGRAIADLKKALAGEFERAYFRRNRGWLAPGVAATALTLLAVVALADNREVAGFMTVWLSVWLPACWFLARQAARAWRRAATGGSLLGAGGALFHTLFALPFLGFGVFGLALFAQNASPPAAAVLLGAVAVNLLFYELMKAPTVLGRRMMDRIAGFKLFLTVAETDRLAYAEPPKRTPELFERFLPYALALDVEQKWAEKFADVLAAAGHDGGAYRPGWYHGSGSGFGGNVGSGLAGTLGGAFAGAAASAATPPGSSSGSGGGGSSGGGGGGGGGGGW